MATVEIDRPRQRMAALGLANEVRIANHKLVADLKAMEFVDALDALIVLLRHGNADEAVGAVPIGRLLMAPNRLGAVKVRMLLKAADIFSGDRRFREVSERQRDVLAHRLEHPEILWPATSIPLLRRRRATARP